MHWFQTHLGKWPKKKKWKMKQFEIDRVKKEKLCLASFNQEVDVEAGEICRVVWWKSDGTRLARADFVMPVNLTFGEVYSAFLDIFNKVKRSDPD